MRAECMGDLVYCPVDSDAVFNDDGWMAVHRQAEQAIPCIPIRCRISKRR
ncbi:hypothetical protein [Lonsdalea quercina]